jgi:(p)ppGpp synthase/HD superfamily hydrolase
MALRATLIALKWYRALRCLEFALRYHTGFRKDGRTPEFLHQVEQALFALTVRNSVVHPEDTISAILLHDTLEDYYTHGVRLSDIREVGGDLVATAVELLTNHIDGVEKPKGIYYPQMGLHIIAAFAKACDRMNNQSTMANRKEDDTPIFTAEKIRAKIDETMLYVFPMIKSARRLFPEQEDAYQNVKTVLEQQVRLLEHVLKYMIAAPPPQEEVA